MPNTARLTDLVHQLTALTAALEAALVTTAAPIETIGPAQLVMLDDVRAVVWYPPGQTDTVLSIQPAGTPETRPADARGPYEVCLVQPDRVVYAPTGPSGAVYIIPYTADLP
jgi:hypothetical protein